MAKEPLYFHVRREGPLKTVKDQKTGEERTHKTYLKGAATFAVKKFNDGNLSIGYSVTHKMDNFSKKTGRRIALQRAEAILKNPEKNSSRHVTEHLKVLPHLVRKNIKDVMKRSKELLHMREGRIFGITWADRRANENKRKSIVQLTIE